jgi:two-component system, NtrC family, sensor kinase
MYSPENPELFQLFLAHTTVAIAMLDREMRYIFTSHQWLTDHSLGERDLTGCCHYDIFPEISPRWKTIYQSCLAGALSGEASDFISTDDANSIRWKSCPWYDKAGEIGGIVLFTEIVTPPTEAALPHTDTAGLSALATNLPGMIYQFVLCPNGTQNFTYASDGCRDIYDIEPEAFKQDNRQILDMVHPDDRQSLEKSITVSAETLEVFTWEGRFLLESGSLKWVQAKSLPYKEANGNIVWNGIMIDISDRVQTEIALRKTQKLLENVIDNSPSVISVKDLQGRYILVNQGFEKVYNLKSQNVIGKSDREIFPQRADYLENQDQQVFKTLTPLEWEDLIPSSDGLHYYMTVKFPICDETGIPYAIAGKSTDITARKQIEAAKEQSEARYRDLAGREKLLNRLSNQIRNTLDLDTVLETTIQEIHQLLKLDRCAYAWYRLQGESPAWDVIKEARNPNLPSLLGFYPSPKVGSVSKLLLQQRILRIDDAKLVSEEKLQTFLQSLGYTSLLALPIQTPAGKVGVLFCGHCNISRNWNDSEVEMLQAVADQLTIAINQAELYTQSLEAAVIAQKQTKQLEQTLQKLQNTQSQLVQSEKMSSLGQLVAGVAHEINNPVNFIYGNIAHANEYAQDLLKLLLLYQQEYPQPSEEIQEEIAAVDLDFLITDLPKLLSSMKIGAVRIREIVNSLRNFSRLDEADMKAVDIHEGIDSTLMILQNRLKAKPDYPGIEVIKEYENLPPTECYPGQLNQVFMNLLSNAIDALEHTFTNHQNTGECVSNYQPQIRICTEIVKDDNELLAQDCLTVRIRDNGPGMTPEIEQRAFDPFFTTKPVGLGTGLGLSISYQIVVEKHGGKLFCSSEVGKGTEFVIQIPLQQK